VVGQGPVVRDTAWVSRALVVTRTTAGTSGRWEILETYSINSDGDLVVTLVEPNLHPLGSSTATTQIFKRQ
jgi:hypothetical protein